MIMRMYREIFLLRRSIAKLLSNVHVTGYSFNLINLFHFCQKTEIRNRNTNGAIFSFSGIHTNTVQNTEKYNLLATTCAYRCYSTAIEISLFGPYLVSNTRFCLISFAHVFLLFYF